jgi:thiol-disulfide isomerase/thioredoxin
MRGLLALAALLWACTAQADGARELFAATLTGLDDKPVALAKWQGKPLIVNFWARWCGPCRTEIPALVELRQRNLGQGLEVLGIAIEDKTEAVRDFAKAYEMDYPVLLARDKGFALMKAFGNDKLGLPFTVAIDRSGKVVVVRMGAMNHDELAAAAAAALK